VPFDLPEGVMNSNLGKRWLLSMPIRMPYPSDVSGKEWAFVVLYLVLVYASEPGNWLRLIKPRYESITRSR
jgi:hypothetical protein